MPFLALGAGVGGLPLLLDFVESPGIPTDSRLEGKMESFRKGPANRP